MASVCLGLIFELEYYKVPFLGLFCFWYMSMTYQMAQRSKFASAVGKCRGISTFFSICLCKKKCRGNWMMMMFFKQISNLLSWGRSFTILSTYFCILFPHFCSLISVSKKLNIERILTLPYSHKWQKCNKINERKSQGCQSVGAEYVAEQINSLTL